MYPAWTEALARQHVVQLRSAASAEIAAAAAKNVAAPPPSARQRAGWALIQLGLWLAVPRNHKFKTVLSNGPVVPIPGQHPTHKGVDKNGRIRLTDSRLTRLCRYGYHSAVLPLNVPRDRAD